MEDMVVMADTEDMDVVTVDIINKHDDLHTLICLLHLTGQWGVSG